MAVGDLTTPEHVKDYLGVVNISDDDLITRLVSAASASFQNQLQRDLTLKSRTETYEWNLMTETPPHVAPGVKRFRLRNVPVASVTGVSIDGQAIPAQGQAFAPWWTPDPTMPAETQPGWVERDDCVEIVGWWFFLRYLGLVANYYVGVRYVDVTYTGGYVSYDQSGVPSGVPGDIEQAVIELTGDMLRRRDRIGIRSRSVAGETQTYLIDSIPPTVQSVIDQYRRPNLG